MPPSNETSERPKPIILSLRDEKFKSIIYRHFRLLGINKNRDKEIEAQQKIWDELIKDVVKPRHFCKLRDEKRVAVTEQKAFEFIRETLQRRHSTAHLWLEKSKANQLLQKKQSTPIGKGELKALQTSHALTGGGTPSDQSEDETLASMAASKHVASAATTAATTTTSILKRKSPRLKDEQKKTSNTSITSSSSEEEPQSPDILLSMLDPYYKQTVFHYFERRKRDSSLSTVQATDEIYAKFRTYLGKTGGKYYKIGHKGGEKYEVNEDEVIKKIKTDLNKSNRYQNELSQTIVLDLRWDTKFSRVMYKYYNSLPSNTTERQEMEAAEQVLNELKQRFIYFIRIIDGERVEIKDDEDVILDIILANIQSREQCKTMWLGNGANQSAIQSEYKTLHPITEYSATSSEAIIPTQFNEQSGRLPRPKSPSEIRSILDERLPNRKQLTVNSRTSIETVSQLIQILQLITLKLNDMLGTQRRHCKVIRLYQLPEFGGDITGAPTLNELARYMTISQVNIRKWYDMCEYAEKRGFDLRLLGHDRIDRHRGIFEEGAAEEELCMVHDSAEEALEQHFDQVASLELAAMEKRGETKTVKSSLDELQESDDETEVDAAAKMNGHSTESNEMLPHTDEISGDAAKKATLHLDSSAIQENIDLNSSFSEAAKENKKATNVPENNGYAQTAAELAMDSDHSNAKGIKYDPKIEDLTDSLEPPLVDHDFLFDDATLSQDASHSNEAGDTSNIFEEEVNESYSQMKSSIARISDAICNTSESAETNRKQPAEKSPDDVTPQEEIAAIKPSTTSKQDKNNLLSKIQKGSRIMVRWGKDGSLYKATVKKVKLDSDAPTIKIHYDGKKSHIRDSIGSESIHSIIYEENMLSTGAETNNDTCTRSDQSHIVIKDLLRGKYPNSLPLGKLEHREQCSELGAGWTVYITWRRNQEGQKRLRADRYFISPSGKSFRSIRDLENYRLECPEEFDLCSVTEDSDDAVTEDLAALSNTTRKSDTNAPSIRRKTNESEMKGTETKASLPQCQEASTTSNPETEISHFGVDSFSPLMMGNPGPAIEDSHSDHEFLSSLMDEKGLLFGEEELEEDLGSLPTRDQSQATQSVATDTMQACTLKPITSCMKCPSPSPKERESGDAAKKDVHVHFAEEPDLSKDEALEPGSEVRKRGLSPRMKHNKKALIGGIVPLFAMDVPVGAEFAGYLGDGHSDIDSDSEIDSDEEDYHGPPRAAAFLPDRSQLSPKLSPTSIQNHGSASFVRISPIALRSADHPTRPNEKEQAKGPKSTHSPNEVTAINTKPAHSAFVTVPRTAQPGLTPPIFPPTSSPLKRASAKKGEVQLFAFDYDSGKKDETSNQRPKRKLKATVRFDPDMAEKQTNGCRAGIGFACPRCDFICDYSSKMCNGCHLECYYEAGVGVVSLKDRDSISATQTIVPPAKKAKMHHSRPEGVLCNCTYCDKGHFSIQGIYAHHGRAHGDTAGKKLDWSKVTFSCPFCKSNHELTLSQVERHVRDYHPGCELVTPNTNKHSRNKSRSKVASPPPPSIAGSRVTRAKHVDKTDETSPPSPRHESPETVPKWEKLDHRSLLPDCKKDYPREIPNIIDLIEEQCRVQENVIATARDQRQKLCKAEAEMAAKMLEEDRLAYQRGIRERSRHADAERIEKQRYTEAQKLMAMQYEYENRNRKRTREEIEADKLCSKPIVFSGTKARQLPGEKSSCTYDQCELCKTDSLSLQSVMLVSEMASVKKDDPSSQGLPPKATVLMPSFQAISKSYLTEAEDQFDQSAEGEKKQSRRDVATSKRLRLEEDKLFKMRSDQRSLEFIHKYNEGFIQDAWKTTR